MTRQKKPGMEHGTDSDKIQFRNFVLVAGNPTKDNIRLLDESLGRIKKEFTSYYSVYILHACVEKPDKGHPEYPFNQPVIQLTDPVKDMDKMFNREKDQGVYIWLNLDKLVKTINFNDFFREEIKAPGKHEYYQIIWEEKEDFGSSGVILSGKESKNILSRLLVIKDFANADVSGILTQSPLLKRFHVFRQGNPFLSPKGLLNHAGNPIRCMKRWFLENFIPSGSYFREKYTFRTGRLIFSLLALIILIIIPLISYNAGISGDEEKHYMQAEKVYKYFSTDGKDVSSLTDEKYKLNYYGQSFDLFTYAVIKAFKAEKIYEIRHVLNGILGALGILCAGLLARLIAGNLAGIITLILLGFSPGYLGHAMNNPLDIPFALGYIFTMLQLVRFLKRLPEINYVIALLLSLGIAFTISIRIGGLVLIPYIFMFSGLYILFSPLPWRVFSKPWFRLAVKGITVLSMVSVLSYFLSILPWPYALQNPLKNPFDALKMMSNISVSLRVMFEGKVIWSDNLPPSYIPKSILISIPLIVLGGILAVLFFIRRNRNAFWLFLLLFITVFPVVYIIYKESNVYGAWRHLLFIYPAMTVLAGTGLAYLLDFAPGRYLKTGILVLLLAGLIHPVSHIFRNYPNQYIYFNELAGGVKKAYKKYETDYYMISLKQGTDWIKSNILEKIDSQTSLPVRIVSNAPADIMKYYFRNFKEIVELPYTRYYDRGLYDWDYAVFFCNYIDPYQISHGVWPPKNTIYTVEVDGVKIGAVVKRVTKDDFKGYEMLSDAIKTRDSDKLDKSVELLENAINLDKYNEISYLNLAQAYIMREEFDLARKKLSILLGFYPNYEKALNMIGYSFMNEAEITGDPGKLERAITIFNDVIRINFKFAGAYHNLGLANVIKGNDEEAFKNFQLAIDNNPNSKESYYMIANLFEKRGDPVKAKQIREYASRL